MLSNANVRLFRATHRKDEIYCYSYYDSTITLIVIADSLIIWVL